MTKTIHLPRITPTINPRVQSLLSEEAQRQLQKIQLPDHVVAVRQECAYQFLEEVFLPQVAVHNDLDCGWIIQKTRDFKADFQAKYPSEFKDFSLIESVRIKLELLQMTTVLDSETLYLIKRGNKLLQRIIQDYGSDLYQV